MRPDAAAPSREENQCDRLESRGYSRRDRALHARRCAGSDTWRPDRHLARDVGALEQYRPRVAPTRHPRWREGRLLYAQPTRIWRVDGGLVAGAFDACAHHLTLSGPRGVSYLRRLSPE